MDFVERFFDFPPDVGSGMFEVAILCVVVGILGLSTRAARVRI
jgi:hypothetical protein